jgi:hypothetical protein
MRNETFLREKAISCADLQVRNILVGNIIDISESLTSKSDTASLCGKLIWTHNGIVHKKDALMTSKGFRTDDAFTENSLHKQKVKI